MQNGELIQLYAEHGYMIAPDALTHIKVHNNHQEILKLFDTISPETLTISLSEIRKIHKSKRMNAVVRYVASFPARPVLVKKTNSFMEQVKNSMAVHHNGGQK